MARGLTARFGRFRGFGYRMLVWPGRKGRERRGLEVGGDAGTTPQARLTELPAQEQRAIETGELRITEG